MKDSFYIQWHITNLCNLRCKHCYQDDFSKKGDLDWAGLKKVSDNLLTTMREWDQKACIHLTGGEPLLKPELFPLLSDLDQQSMVEELGIITNGLPIDQEMIKRLSGFSKLKKIKISLDGGDAETNDSIRRKGTFDKVMQNLPLIKEKGRFEILFMFTAMKRNFKSLPSLFKLCQDLGVDGLIIERFIPLGRGREIMGEVLSKEEWKEMIGMLLDFFSTEEEDHSFIPYQAFQISFSGEEPELLGGSLCHRSGWSLHHAGGKCFSLSEVSHFNRESSGSTHLKRYGKNQNYWKKLRRKENLKGKCGSCQMKDCRGCRSLALALTGDYLEEDPHCWHHDV